MKPETRIINAVRRDIAETVSQYFTPVRVLVTEFNRSATTEAPATAPKNKKPESKKEG